LIVRTCSPSLLPELAAPEIASAMKPLVSVLLSVETRGLQERAGRLCSAAPRQF
jgi:hypothetical protein